MYDPLLLLSVSTFEVQNYNVGNVTGIDRVAAIALPVWYFAPNGDLHYRHHTWPTQHA